MPRHGNRDLTILITEMYLSVMRTKAPTALPLFRSEFQLRLLALILLQPDRAWTAKELQAHLGGTPASVHRELQRALAAGVIVREGIGRTYRYQAAEASPIIEPLRELLERTVGIETDLRKAFEGLAGIKAAVIHGSYARGTRIKPTSDVDVLVLGEPDFRALQSKIRRLERRAGRQIDVLVYTPDEFRDMLTAGSSFARGLIRGPTKSVVGDLNDVVAA
jgi:predicted nucleotidyltransferase